MKSIIGRDGNVTGFERQVGTWKAVRSRSNDFLGKHDERTDLSFTRDGDFAGRRDHTARILGDWLRF
jgi:hypothetical protein